MPLTFLSLCTLLCLEPLAAASMGKSTAPRSEVWAATWKPVPADCGLLTPMLYVEGQFTPGRQNTLPDPVPVARQSQTMPQGRVALQWWRYSNSLFLSPADNALVGGLPSDIPSPWTLDAATSTKAEWRTWLERYKAAGGRLDYLVGDCERWGSLKNWDLQSNAPTAIAQDPRAARPWRGAPPLQALLEGVNVQRVMDFTATPDYLAWNRAMGTLTAATMNDAIFEPARAMYPDLRGSNFAGVRTLERPAPDANGHPQAHDNIVGTAAAPAEYGSIDGAAKAWFIDENDPTRLSKSGRERIAPTAWFSFLNDMQHGRACRRSAPTVPLNPWIAFSHWPGAARDVHYPSDQRYWDEMVRHYVLLGTEMFNFWNPTSLPGPDGGPWIAVQQRDEGARRLERLLREVNAKSQGSVKAQASVVPLSYRSDLVTTGAQRVDGSWIWRTTVRPGVSLLRDRRNGTLVPLDANGVGRWDVTPTSTGPDYETAGSVPTSRSIQGSLPPAQDRKKSGSKLLSPSRLVHGDQPAR